MSVGYNAAKRRNALLRFYLALVFAVTALALVAVSYLPWFDFMRPSQTNNPYDLLALEKLPEEQRRATVEGWLNEFEQLSEAERAERLDQYLDALVVFSAEKLDFQNNQTVQTKGLLKSAVLAANEAGITRENAEENRELLQQLGEQIRQQMEAILTPSQQERLQTMMRERRAERERQRGDAPSE